MSENNENVTNDGETVEKKSIVVKCASTEKPRIPETLVKRYLGDCQDTFEWIYSIPYITGKGRTPKAGPRDDAERFGDFVNHFNVASELPMSKIPADICDHPLLDHLSLYETSDGRRLVVSQPYAETSEQREMIESACDYLMLVLPSLTVTYSAEGSWHYPGRTVAVVITTSPSVCCKSMCEAIGDGTVRTTKGGFASPRVTLGKVPIHYCPWCGERTSGFRLRGLSKYIKANGADAVDVDNGTYDAVVNKVYRYGGE